MVLRYNVLNSNRNLIVSTDLLFKKQHKFYLPPAFDALYDLTSIAAERSILLIYVSVSCFQFLYEFAFG